MPPVVPTSRQSLLARGADPVAVDRDRQLGRSVALYRGVHVAAQAAAGWTTRLRAALATQGPLAVVGMQTAAVLLGLRWVPRVWSDPAAPVHLVVPQDDARRHRRGLRLHRRHLAPNDICLVGGIACLTATRTLAELARDATLPELLIVQLIDGALLDGRVTVSDLLATLARYRGERGVALARRRVLRARPRVRSPQETRFRLMLEDADITVDVPLELTDDAGLVVAEGDFGSRRHLIWGEYDGYDTHREQQAFRRDRIGDRALARRGWQVMRFVDADFDNPAQRIREWRQAEADAPARIAALDPARSPEVAAARRMLGIDR